ncbi:MAG: hydrolase, partial [Pyrobaculum sp.]
KLAGVTVDWRDVGSPPAGLEEALARAESMGFVVVRYRRHPFADIYASRRDKGDAVRLLKALLGVTHVVYLGDSENDLPAWRLADVKILVRHKYNAHLREGIPVRQEELHKYLREVLQAVKSHAAAGI